MPRGARKESKSCFYHTIVQGINKEYIFGKEEYIQMYKKIISKKLKDSNVTILAYCIMNNHAHFLMYSEKSAFISKYMQKLNIAYSTFYNKVNKRVGYVFRDRFYSQEILSQRQLYICLKYIHNNPVKAKITKNMSEYKHSSYNEFFGEKCIIDDESLKLLFGTTKNFKEQFNFIHNTLDDDNEIFIDIKEKNISDFIYEMEETYNKKINEMKNEKSILKNVIKEARNQTDVTIEELAQILEVSKSTVGNYSKK